MAAGITVGDFSRATHLSVKTLRHYHQIGLLPEPERDASGYRRYGAAAIDQYIRGHLARASQRAAGIHHDANALQLAIDLEHPLIYFRDGHEILGTGQNQSIRAQLR